MKLLRKSSNRQIAGVCAGLAEYLDIDPTVMRAIFAVGILCGTSTFWVYMILLLVMPD